MGEQKRREANQTPYEKMLTELSRKLTDEGKLIEAGWVGLRKHWMPEAAPPDQVADMRKAFMAGAQHLFSSIMTVLEPDEEPTDADIARMGLISDELDAFGRELVIDLPVEGSA